MRGSGVSGTPNTTEHRAHDPRHCLTACVAVRDPCLPGQRGSMEIADRISHVVVIDLSREAHRVVEAPVHWAVPAVVRWFAAGQDRACPGRMQSSNPHHRRPS